MEKFKLKPLIKFILKEIEEKHYTANLVDDWKQISPVKNGRMRGTRGYFIMKNGKLADASFEMEGSSGLGGGVDHYGYTLALDNRKIFGIPDELADNPDEDDNYSKIWSYIKKAAVARVMLLPNSLLTHRPDITIQWFSLLSPSSLRTLQGWIGTKLPDVPENSTVNVELENQDGYVADTIREFLSARSFRDLRKY